MARPKVGDLIAEIGHEDIGYAVVVAINDRRKKEPYKVYCDYWKSVISLTKKYVEDECRVVSEGR
jgi:hypothetical protein